MTIKNFSIIGGGIAGLSGALAVEKAGAHAYVFEKTAAFDHVGAGLQLGPNAVRALADLDAWDAVEAFAFAPPEIHIRSGQTGKILKRIKLGEAFATKFGAPYRVAHRADLHSALLSVVQSKPGIELELGADTEAVALSGQGPVLGADGIWSQTRAALFPQAQVVRLEDVIYRSLNTMPEFSGPVALDCVNLWLFPGGHVVHYPVGHPLKLNLVAVTQGQTPLEHFKSAAFDLQLMLTNVEAWTPWPAAHVTGLDHWSKGETLLIGDAAHGTVPYLAQGAAMALEDAATLSKLLIRSDRIGEIFAAFEQSRIRRCGLLDEQSRANGRIYHLHGTKAAARDLVLALSPARAIAARQDWIYAGQ